jgi:hypothetical protein
MRKWFLAKFPDGYFGENNEDFYVAGQHAFHDFRTRSKEKMLKKNRPSVTMSARANLEYDRDKIDMYPYGVNLYLSRFHTTAENSFFVDKRNNIMIAQDFEIMDAEIHYTIRLATKAQQFDMYKYCRMLFRVGATQGEYADYDQHIPYGLMRQIATDAGFEIANGKIVDIISFVKYLNSNSNSPILYKFRNITGNDEFFIRVRGAYVHISVPELEIDDGQDEGQAYGDFTIGFTAKVRFPMTKCYIYTSDNKHTEIRLREEVKNVACFSTIRMIDAPDYNERGWKKALTTEYEEKYVEDECLSIDLSSLLSSGNLGRVIKYSRDIKLSILLFLDIRLFNNGKEIPYIFDEDKLVISSISPVESTRSFITCYVDMEYINNQITVLDKITHSGRL